MSVGNVRASRGIEQWLGRDQGAGTGEGFSLADKPLKRLSVDLPNGFSVSATSIGGAWNGAISAFQPELIDSLMEIVEELSRMAPSGNDGFTPPPGVAPGQRNEDGSPMEYRTLDSFHVELANGYSVDVSHTSLPGGGDNDAAALAAMAETLERLTDRFGAEPADLRPDPTADLLPGSSRSCGR